MSHSEPISNSVITQIISNAITREKNIGLTVLRLDLIHPIVSGNKWFKLRHYLHDAREKKYRTLVTFGGAYSNHIVATAYAAKLNGFNSEGIIRGEEPPVYSPTLSNAIEYGMNLHFVSRAKFAQLRNDPNSNDFYHQLEKPFLIPEGGFGETGMKGASEILDFPAASNYSHIVVAVGTGCTAAGILHSANPNQTVIGISVLKGNEAEFGKILELSKRSGEVNFILNHDYHFGGYAKKNQSLIDFMNEFYNAEKIPTDFVYTGKLMFSIYFHRVLKF